MRLIRPIYMQDYAPGYTLFTRPVAEGFLSDGIIWFEQLDEVVEYEGKLKGIFPKGKGFSHVISVIDEKTGMEADEKGIHISNLDDYFKGGKYFVVCREPEGLNAKAVMEKLVYQRSLLGNPYDFTVYPSFMFNAITRLSSLFSFIRKLPPLGHTPGARICSSFEADGFYHTDKYRDIQLFKEWNVLRIHPHRLWKHFPYKPLRFDKERKGVKLICH